MEQVQRRTDGLRINFIKTTTMRKGLFATIIGIMLLGGSFAASAQEYVATPVTVSQNKVTENGREYYAHVVLERQTLYSISKAYGVTVQEIYDANPALNLETRGLQTSQVILIPVKDGAAAPTTAPAAAPQSAPQQPAQPQPQPVQQTQEQTQEQKPQQTQQAPVSDDFLVHTVKWYEDLRSIAKKYGMSPEAIIKFNGLESPSLSWKQRIKIPLAGDAILGIDIPQDDGQEEEGGEEGEDKSIIDQIRDAAEDFLFRGKKNVKATLILPLDAKGTPSENIFDFYCGALLAIRDLGYEGIGTELTVLDCAKGAMPATEAGLRESDVILGPISTADISKTLEICPGSRYIISPLEPKALNLANTCSNIVHAPCAADQQCRSLIDWLKADFRSSDKVILFTEKGITPTGNAATILAALQQSGLQYSTMTYGILESRDVASHLEKMLSTTGTSRVVIASESEAFVNDVVRNVNLMVFRKHDMALYCPSKARSFETIEVDNFHNTNMHVVTSYFINYDSSDVKNFLMKYRALFGAEPSPFAYQGYDTAYFFIKTCSTYGDRWPEKLDETTHKGLQSDFRFEKTDSGSYVNKAVRKVIYGPSYSINLVR